MGRVLPETGPEPMHVSQVGPDRVFHFSLSQPEPTRQQTGGSGQIKGASMSLGEPSSGALLKNLNEATIQLHEEGEESQQSHSSLVGKLLTDKILNKGVVKEILRKAWGELKDLKISDVGQNMFLFTFNSQEEAQQIFCKAPWYVMNKLISLQFWNPQVAMREIDFSYVQFWVQLQGLPLEFITIKSAEKILSQMSTVVEVEDPRLDGQLVRNFIRARVEINILQPLSTGCWVPRKDLPKLRVFIKYERLQDLCFNCGVIGHEQKTCKRERVMSAVWPGVQRFGNKVGIPPARAMKFIKVEHERRRRKQQGDHLPMVEIQLEGIRRLI